MRRRIRHLLTMMKRLWSQMRTFLQGTLIFMIIGNIGWWTAKGLLGAGMPEFVAALGRASLADYASRSFWACVAIILAALYLIRFFGRMKRVGAWP